MLYLREKNMEIALIGLYVSVDIKPWIEVKRWNLVEFLNIIQSNNHTCLDILIQERKSSFIINSWRDVNWRIID